jgi:methionine-rich copper-binding protein CopC
MIARPLRFAAAGVAFALTASQAFAHAHLLKSEPAADAVVATPAQIALHFNEKLEGRFSGFDVLQGEAKTPVKVALGADGATLVGAPAKPLAPGAYKVQWHAVGHDGHRLTGGFAFTVK